MVGTAPTKQGVLCVFLTMLQALVTTVTPAAIERASVMFSDVGVNMMNPIAVSLAESGNIIALDAGRRSLVVASVEDGTWVSSRSLLNGVPYSHVLCDTHDTVIVSYTSGNVMDTVSIGGDSGELYPQLNGTLSDHPDVIISDMTANTECSLIYVLDGVNKKIFEIRDVGGGRMQLHGPWMASLQELSEPTSILLFVGELFLADWAQGSIYVMHVGEHPSDSHAQNQSFSLLAGTKSQEMMADTNDTHVARLSGPTQMSAYQVITVIQSPLCNASFSRDFVRFTSPV